MVQDLELRLEVASIRLITDPATEPAVPFDPKELIAATGTAIVTCIRVIRIRITALAAAPFDSRSAGSPLRREVMPVPVRGDVHVCAPPAWRPNVPLLL
jgi:hypothetical protein